MSGKDLKYVLNIGWEILWEDTTQLRCLWMNNMKMEGN